MRQMSSVRFALVVAHAPCNVEAGDITEGVLSEEVIPDGIARDAEIEAALGDQATALDDVTSGLTTAEASITTLEGSLATLGTAVEAAEDALDALDADVTANASAIADVATDVAALETTTAATDAALSALTGRVSLVEADLANLDDDLLDLTSDVDDLADDVTSLTSSLSSSSAAAAAALATHAADPDAHHVKTTDAADLVSGTLSVARLPGDVLLQGEITPSGAAASRIIDFSQPLTVTNQQRVTAATVTAAPGGDADITLTAHVYLERDYTSGGALMITLRRNDCEGANLGTTFWNPPVVPGATLAGDTVTIIGYDLNVTTTTSYALCVRKFDALAPNTTIGPRVLVARW